MRVKYRLLLVLFIFPFAIFSQQRNSHQLFWSRLSFTDTINQKLEWELSIQRRSQNKHSSDPNIFHAFQFEGYALSFQYFFSEKLSFSVLPVGYYRSHVLNVLPSDSERPSTTEWRSNVQLIHESNFRYFIFLNRLSADYRRRDFQNSDHYKTNWRLRYMIRFDKEVFGLFSALKPVTFTLYDEVFFQFGDAVKNNHTNFDQHRLYAGAAYEIYRNTTLNFGYAYGFQIRPSGDQYDDINSYYVALTFENFISQFSKPKVKIKRNTGKLRKNIS